MSDDSKKKPRRPTVREQKFVKELLNPKNNFSATDAHIAVYAPATTRKIAAAKAAVVMKRPQVIACIKEELDTLYPDANRDVASILKLSIERMKNGEPLTAVDLKIIELYMKVSNQTPPNKSISLRVNATRAALPGEEPQAVDYEVVESPEEE